MDEKIYKQDTVTLTLIGPVGSGKTQLIDYIRSDKHERKNPPDPTVGIDIIKESKVVNDPDTSDIINVDLQIHDASGNDLFIKAILPKSLKMAKAVGIVLDTQQENWLDSLKDFYVRAVASVKDKTPIYFIINKTDLINDFNEDKKAEIINQIRLKIPEVVDNHILFCSAETGNGVEDVFKTMELDVLYPKPIAPDPPLSSDEPHKINKWGRMMVNKINYFFSKNKPLIAGNVLLILGIIITLVVLATLPVGGALVLGLPLSALALAGIIGGAAFIGWNAGYAIINWLTRHGDNNHNDNDNLNSQFLHSNQYEQKKQKESSNPTYTATPLAKGDTSKNIETNNTPEEIPTKIPTKSQVK